MRIAYSAVFLLLIAVLMTCAFYAGRSQRKSSYSATMLLRSLVPPLIGNLLVTASGNHTISVLGYYIYFIGMDFVMFSLLRFTFEYCDYSWPSNAVRVFVLSVLGLDILLFLLNPLIHMSFAVEPVLLDGYNYFQVIPFIGQTIHRVIDYLIFITVVILFSVKAARASRINAERYYIFLVVMVLTGLVQTYFIFSRSPIDRSMIGYGIFGVLVFYFALYYRPMRLLDSMLANIASGMNEALFFFDASRRCIWANNPGCKLAGITDELYETAGDTLQAMFPNIPWESEQWTERQNRKEDETVKSYVLEKHLVTDDNGRPVGSFLSIRDNTEDQALLEKEQYRARHDALTDLYNQKYLFERVQQVISENPDTDYYVIFINLREFKLINDIFGTEFGDHTLIEVANWIRSSFPSEYSVYGRISGDTFGVCLPCEKFDEAALDKSLSDFIVDNGTISHPVLIHLGVYQVTERDQNASVMFDRAHMALTPIRNQFTKHIAYYDEAMRRQILWNQQITAQLHTAIKNREIRPYLQPIVDRSGTIVGAEALVRWHHPTEGFLSPSKFVPVFETNGMISEVDRYMWRSACEILARWKEEGLSHFISVNISPIDFYYMDVPKELNGLVKEFAIDPGKLRIEITESVMMANEESRMKMLRDLRDNGFLVEIDDFGSGYSSLNLLKDMPADILKIDMVFLRQSKTSARAKIIVNNIIRMSHDLNIIPLTEGVETETQFHALSDMHCELFQGFYFAKPMPVEEFESLCTGANQQRS